ncbi:MAG: hypothetical protein NTY65_02090 [Planctomycetota bacterium]|nr:hypothetical protein [Planctomycetota bacterium]
MAVCDICEKRRLFRRLNPRLEVPEYRAMTGFWPWVELRVCDACLADYDREFTERLRLLAPDVLENDEPVAMELCLACGSLESHGRWHQASRWVDAENRPARRATFYLCHRHKDLPYVEGIVVASNLLDAERMQAVLDELPAAGADLLTRVEGWRPEAGHGPPGAMDFTPGWKRDAVATFALDFWKTKPDGLKAKAAWLGPVRKDYRLRYRLDLVRDFATHQRETLSIVRIGTDLFATYRTVVGTSAK